MRYMNEWDIESAVQRYDPAIVPNRAYLAAVVSALRDWTNQNSDGWPYWPKPARAADRAMALIESTTTPENMRREEQDATDAEVAAALRPIKALLTRQGVRHEAVIPARQMALAFR